MADSILNLILRTVRSGSGAKEAVDDLDKVKNKTEETKDALGSMNRGWADVKAGFDLLGQGLGYAQAAFDMTIGKAAEWGDAMGDLSQLTGTSVRETSELAATLELLGIKQDGLNKIVKAFTAQGLQPTMTNIRALAAEYQAIQDPIEKNEFLFKRFGRQAADVAEILGKSTEELDSFTEAARQSGKVVDEEAAAAAERLGVEMEKLKQRSDGVAISLGNALIPILNKYFEVTEKTTEALKRENAVGLEASLGRGALRVATVDLVHDTDRLTTAIEEETRSTSSLSAESERWAGVAEAAAQAAERKAAIDRIAATDAQNYAQAQRDAVQALADLQAKQDGWASSTGQNVINALERAGVKGREYEAALIAVDAQLGTSFAKDEEKQKKLDELTRAYADGKISVDDYKAGLNLLYAKDMPETKAAFENARDAAGEYADKLDRMDGRRVQTFVDTVYRELREAAGGIHDTATGDLKQTTPLGGGRANGLDMIVPPGYPNDTYGPIYAQSGERVQVTPAGQVTNNMGGVTIIVNGAGDPRATAEEVSRVLAQQARGLTQSGIAYMG